MPPVARRRRRWIFWSVVALVVVWVGLAALLAVLGVAAGHRGERVLERAQRDRTYEALISPATGQRLGTAERHFAHGHDLLSNPLLYPFRYLPILGRQLRTADRLNEDAATATGIAGDAVAEVRGISEGPTPHGEERITLLRRLSKVVDDSHRRLAAIDIPEDEALIGPVDDVRTTFADKRDEAVDALDRASAVLGSLQGLLEGRTYLVFGANNAEMRAGSGMFLSATTLTTKGGHLHIGDVRPTNRLVLAKGVETPQELAQNWSWLDTGKDFRNLALSPRFAQSAEIASRMWEQVPGGGPVDGVLAVDAEALAQVMKVVGPVTVNGTKYTSETVRYQLLNGQYLQFPKNREERTDQLGEVARAVFDKLEQGDWKVGRLANALISSVGGRHLLLWSGDKQEQAGWAAASADGPLEDDSLAVSVLSRGANKLDYFLRASAKITTHRVDAGTDVQVAIELHNPVPSYKQPRYVEGPNVEGLQPGEYAGIVTVNVPSEARNIRFTGGSYSTLVGRDGPTQTEGRYLRIPRGADAELVLRFRLPTSVVHMTMEPSGRVKPLRWYLNGHEYKVEKRRTLEFGDSP
jgi:hypothetical protein